jgi:hypothetical protein
MNVVLADLHEHASALVQQLSCNGQTIAKVAEVAVHPERPRVPVGLDLLRLPRKRVVLAVLHLALVNTRLEIAVVGDPVRRIDVNHLDVTAEVLLVEQGVHHQQRVAQHHPVHPELVVLVELDGLGDRQALVPEETELHGFVLHQRDDVLRPDDLVLVERDRVHLDLGALRLAGPDELRVEVRVVLVLHLRRHLHLVEAVVPRLGVVGSRHVLVEVVLGAGLGLRGLLRCHGESPRERVESAGGGGREAAPAIGCESREGLPSRFGHAARKSAIVDDGMGVIDRRPWLRIGVAG